MSGKNTFEIIIVGGSYAGISAAMALGRARRSVLVIDSGKPCNRQTPHSHNFITQDGETPSAILQKAREQVAAYPTIQFLEGKAIKASGAEGRFEIATENGEIVRAMKVLLATGVHDILMPIDGFAECWGISVLHCPYCHGYEVRDEALGVIANGEMAFEYARMIRHWTPDLTLFTNRPSTLKTEHREKLESHGIAIVEKEIAAIEHEGGYLKNLLFQDGTIHALKAIFARSRTEMHSDLYAQLGCELSTEGFTNGLLKTDEFGKTTLAGVFAAGDAITAMRSVASAVATGNKTGAFMNNELIAELF